MNIFYYCRRSFVVCVLGFMLSLTGTNALSLNMNCGTKPIRLSFYEHGFLYYENSKGDAEGIDKDIVDELIKRSGCKFDTGVKNRERIWESLSTGALDMSVSGTRSAGRDSFGWFVIYMQIKNDVLINSKVAQTVHSSDDFLAQPKLKLGVVQGFLYGTGQDQLIEELREQERVLDSTDVSTTFRRLQEHVIDAVFSMPPVYLKYIQNFDMRNDVVIQNWTPDEKGIPFGLVMAKSRFSEADAAQWRVLIDGMRADGTLKRIFSHYLPPDEVVKLLNF